MTSPGDPNGSQNIMVTAMLGDSVLKVRQLEAKQPGKGKGAVIYRVLQATGAAIFLVGVVYAAMSQVGLASLLMLAGLGQVVFASTRLRLNARAPHFTLGSGKSADMHLADAALPDGLFPVVQRAGDSHYLWFTDAMAGHVDLPGEGRVPLNALAATGRAHPVGHLAGAHAFPIPRDSRAEVEIGDSAILVSSVSPAGGAERPLVERVDWTAQVFNGASFAAHALVLFLVLSLPPSSKELTLEMFKTAHKLVGYTTRPELQKEEVPEWLRKQQLEDAGRAGQAHKGEMGEMGDPKVDKKKKKRFSVKGPRDNPNPMFAKQLAKEMVKNTGLIKLLGPNSKSRFAHIWGTEGALGDQAEDAMGKLVGDSVGEGYGIGGLGPIGSGRGGGGVGTGIGVGALGTIGDGGWGNKRGKRYAASARMRRLTKGATVPPVRLKPPKVDGCLSKSIIRRIVRRHLNQVKYCYTKELQNKRDLYGRIVVKFSIASTGQVVSSSIQKSTLNNIAVESCVAQAVRRWLFPKPEACGLVVVSYPFILTTPHGK